MCDFKKIQFLPLKWDAWLFMAAENSSKYGTTYYKLGNHRLPCFISNGGSNTF
jgi:hypothetical protein